MYNIAIRSKSSFVRKPLSSSSKDEKMRCRSILELSKAGSPFAFSNLGTKLAKSETPILPLWSLSNSSKTARGETHFAHKWLLKASSTSTRDASSCRASMSRAWLRNFDSASDAAARRLSKPLVQVASLRACVSSHTRSSSRSSAPDLNVCAVSCTFDAASRAPFATSATLFASAEVSAGVIAAIFPARAFVWLSSSLTAVSAACIAAVASATLASCFALASSSSFSLSSRIERRASSLAISRATPTITFSRWKSAHDTPFAPSPTTTLKTWLSRSGGSEKPNSTRAYCETSLRLQTPSRSRSYFLKMACAAAIFLFAPTLLTSFTRSSFDLLSIAST
mmetsp:Transcript_78760/g.218912  ORF Transcript_78760/g.218912 Transcript_78760/m.218912 type:complete len:338 (-) Transcript_78760:1355-2368(-)